MEKESTDMAGPLKIGLIGTGSIANLHVPAFARFPDRVKLTALCDVREEAAQQFGKNTGVEAVYTDAARMLREADIEAVDICAIHDQHAPLAIAAAKAGKHVLLEKPMATTLQECHDIIAATDKAGVTFMVAQQLRHLPGYAAVRRLIQEGELGRVWSLRADNWMPAFRSRTTNRRPDWWALDGKRAGGGALPMFVTHHIDLFRYFIGDVKRVWGKVWTDHPFFTNGADDSAVATLEFESGAIGHLSTSFSAAGPHGHQFIVFGTEGTVYTAAPPGSSPIAQHQAPAMVSSLRRDGDGGPGQAADFVPVVESVGEADYSLPYVNEILHFAECCREGEEPISSGRDNLGTMKVIFGIYQSSRTGEPVDLSSL